MFHSYFRFNAVAVVTAAAGASALAVTHILMHVYNDTHTTKGKEEERQMFQQMQAMAQKQVTISFSLAPISFFFAIFIERMKSSEKYNMKKTRAHTATHKNRKKRNMIMFI